MNGYSAWHACHRNRGMNPSGERGTSDISGFVQQSRFLGILMVTVPRVDLAVLVTLALAEWDMLRLVKK